VTRINVRPSLDGKVYGNHERRIRGLEFRAAGGSSSHGITAVWGGVLPSSVGSFTGTTWRVPELAGASHTWTLTLAYLRCETPPTAGDTVVVIEKMSPDGDTTWATATTVATLTISGVLDYETSGVISVSVTTGDLLRIRFTTVNASGLFTVEATGS
jgi:hypothetical protein